MKFLRLCLTLIHFRQLPSYQQNKIVDPRPDKYETRRSLWIIFFRRSTKVLKKFSQTFVEKKKSCPYPEISFSPAAQNRKNELLKFMLIDRSPLPKRSLGRNRSADLKLLRKWMKITKRSLAWAIMERWNGPEPEPSPSFKSQALLKAYLQKDGLWGCFFAFELRSKCCFPEKNSRNLDALAGPEP